MKILYQCWNSYLYESFLLGGESKSLGFVIL